MPTTRSSAVSSSSPAKQQDDKSSPKETAGTKRKAGPKSPAKSTRGRKSQKTIEETMPEEEDQPEDVEMKDDSAETKSPSKLKGKKSQKTIEETMPDEIEEADGQESGAGPEDESKEVEKAREEKTAEVEDQETEAKDSKKSAGDSKTENGAIEKSAERESAVPSNVLEKGIIYFFTRGRVGIEDPEGAGDLARTYFVLRPIPLGAKLGEGTIEDSNTNRLFALPKKVFPKRHRDRFLAFVDKAGTTIADLRENYFGGSTYETKTVGTRHTPAVTPIGEGVYSITRTGDTTHLIYMLTIPSELGEVQNELGLRSRASFFISVKNPERRPPPNANLPDGPKYPKKIIEEFAGYAWVPVKPEYLDYDRAQILLIGEDEDGDLKKAVEPTGKDKKNDEKETPLEEMEKLEHEDELRVEHLDGDDTIFDDLKLSHEEYSRIPTTW
ncbi:hypothetical protein M501DRAFT_981441 [Patellaria atrata CBS 101060]|uniref:BTB domain transcription factor n=1 Tax=Patellaria atrata CBS 101060 TaxID=1346257 RepID=A0A9P4S4F0_9PEZI|nr:hypothetical protein M501DRAFT_981441 [Patellaria atrata CBS 101060]